MIRYVRCIDIVIIRTLIWSRQVGRRVESPLRRIAFTPSWVLPLITSTSTLVTPRVSLVSILVLDLVTLILITLVSLISDNLILSSYVCSNIVANVVTNTYVVIVPGPGSRSYRVPTLPDPTGYYYCTLQLGCCIVEAICSVHSEVN